MVNVRSYISANFSKAFLTIFLPFFLIISLVYLVKIASLTSKVVLTFSELLTLYSYSIPDIIFYTLPISFVAALANTLIRLSADNELIVIYALGLKANSVVRGLLVLGALFSILLLSISFFTMPLTKQMYKSFKQEKKAEAKLNIVPGKFGQKFGEFYIYVKDKNENHFNDVVIFNRENRDSEQFLSANEGELKIKGKISSLLLTDGHGYTYSKDKLKQAKYKTLEVFQNIKKRNYKFEDIINYWRLAKTNEKRMHRLLFYMFVSLIPFISIYLIASFTMINPRYQSNNTFLVIFGTIFLFYSLASSLQKYGSVAMLVAFIVFTAILGRWLFNIRVARYF